mmetsp:Transcript_32163/g.96372  ORF Transcript_32163/g.96372 Transcript_32163/m.96372 type:complete len:407 (-) Transcript_32163:136-1356(-)
MPSNNEALCFFLNQLGSRSMKDVPIRRPSSLKNIVRGNGEESAQYSFPSLALFRMRPEVAAPIPLERPARYDFSTSAEQKSGVAWPKETALHNLSTPVRYTSLELDRAPSEIANRALDSVSFLVAANLRQFLRTQLQRHATGSSRACALKARELASFFLDVKMGGQDEQGGKCIDVIGCSTSFHLHGDDSCDSELCEGTHPITFHMDVDVCVLGRKTTIPVKTEGQVNASFEKDTGRITGVAITLDVNQLLLSMRTQGRLVVLKAVAQKGFPVLHTDADCPDLSKEAQSDPEADQVRETLPPAVVASDKMKNLALCASLELASVINDSSPLSMGASEGDPSRQKQKRTSKRRLTMTMGRPGALFAPSGKRAMISKAPGCKVNGGELPPLSLVLAFPSASSALAHQA